MNGRGQDKRVFWLDAQLPPALAPWLCETFGVDAKAVRELGLRDASDLEIFEAARRSGAVLVSKDSDFVDLVQRLGTPPRLLWVTCGNVTNTHLKQLFAAIWPDALQLLDGGEPVIEIGREPQASN
jgi:predicted nuclease of predicted toxin-antitoxin system